MGPDHGGHHWQRCEGDDFPVAQGALGGVGAEGCPAADDQELGHLVSFSNYPHTNTNGYNAHEQNFLRFFNNHRVCKGIQRPQSLRMATLESRDSCVSVEPQLRRSEWLVEWFVIALFPNLSSVKATIHPTCEMNWLLKLEHLAQRQPINTWERKEGRRGREDGMERGRETGRKEGKEGDVSPSFFKNSTTVICPLKLLTFK